MIERARLETVFESLKLTICNTQDSTFQKVYRYKFIYYCYLLFQDTDHLDVRRSAVIKAWHESSQCHLLSNIGNNKVLKRNNNAVNSDANESLKPSHNDASLSKTGAKSASGNEKVVRSGASKLFASLIIPPLLFIASITM